MIHSDSPGGVDRPSISVVIPVYNAAGSLHELTTSLQPVLALVTDRFELLLVNDGSRDHSWQVIRELASRFNWVRGLDLMRNYGQHNALLCGVRAASHDIVVTMDDDLQHPPEEIPKLLGRLTDGYDVVYGAPEREQHGFTRNVASALAKLAFRTVTDRDVARNISAFRAFRTDLRRAFSSYESSFVSLDVLLTWATTKFSSVVVRRAPRKIGRSNYNFSRLFRHAITIVTGYSTWPLQLASVVGLGCTILGLLLLLYVVGRYALQGTNVPGFAFLASVVTIFSGAQLFALGIMGEYVARIHSRTLGHPVAVVRDSTGFLAEAIER